MSRWAHFAHNFDTLQLVAAAYRLNWRVRSSFAGQGPLAVDVSPPGEHRWMALRDSYRIVQGKLAHLAEDFNLPSRKLFTKGDYDGDMRDLGKKRLRDGCLTDCRLVLEVLDAVETLLKKFGGQLKSTAAASALSVVKSYLKKQRIQLPTMRHSRRCAHELDELATCNCYWGANLLARLGYYGARVEVFHHCPPWLLQEYDVSSSYPWSMSQLLPVRWTGNVSGDFARAAYRRKVEGIYQATVHVPRRMKIPPLPYKLDDGGLHFPSGTWTAWFPAIELRYAQKLGVRVTIHQGVTYESGHPFKDYVAGLYELKRTATDPSVRQFSKLLLVSSYGKYGEKPERESLVFIPDAHEAEWLMLTDSSLRALDPDGDPRFFAQEEIHYAPHAHYAIAAYITAYSRILLHKEMLRAKGLAYVDTDSLHCARWPGEVGDALGQLKLELSDFYGCYYAPKLYSLHQRNGDYLVTKDKRGERKLHVACKGFAKANEEDFESILESAATFHALVESGIAKADAKKAAREVGQTVIRMRLLKSQLAPKATAHEVLRRKVRKSWSGLSRKRKPFKDCTTRPWTVDELRAGAFKEARCPLL